jgi:hypothetical protein
VIDVRFTPDATKLLRSSEMTRWAIRRHSVRYSVRFQILQEYTTLGTPTSEFRRPMPHVIGERCN